MYCCVQQYKIINDQPLRLRQLALSLIRTVNKLNVTVTT